MQNEGSLQSVLIAAATLVLVLVGSFLLAMSYLIEDEPAAEASRQQDCRAFDACRVASADLKAAYADPNACEGAGARVCLVPMGDVPKDVIDMLVEHYRKSYALTVHVARPLDLRQGFDRDGQLEESLVLEQLRSAYSQYAGDRSVTMIGLVPVDLYSGSMPSSSWSFGRLRGQALPGVPVEYYGGVISLYRMDPRNSGLPPDDALYYSRLRKFVSKYIALGYFDLPISNDPLSVTSNRISDLAELDRVDERIPIR